LPQTVEYRWRELAQLVEEQNASMGERDLAGPQTNGATADQRDHRAAVVRCTERRAAHHATDRQAHTGRGVHHGRGQRNLGSECGQQTRHALREHRLARAGRPDEQQVMAAGRGNLQSEPRGCLAAHVGEIGRRRFIVDELSVGRARPWRLGVQGVDYFAQCAGDAHSVVGHALRLAKAGDCNYRNHIGHRCDHRRDSRDRAQTAIES